MVVTAAVVEFVLVVEGRPLLSIGWRVPPFEVALVAFGGGLGVLLAGDRVSGRVFDALGVGELGETMAGLGALSPGCQVAVAATAGVTAEVRYRGDPIERIAELAGSPLVGGVVATAAFVLVHDGFWDRDQTIRITVPAVLLTWLYLVVRSLPVVIAVHALNDVVELLVARYNADAAPEAPEGTGGDPEAVEGDDSVGEASGTAGGHSDR